MDFGHGLTGLFWLVYSHDFYTDPQGIIPRYLDATLDKQAERAFNGLNIFIYEQR